MPRGRKANIDDKIEKLQNELQEFETRKESIQAKINEKNDELQDALKDKRMEQLQGLSDFLEGAGIPPEEAIKRLKNK